MKQYHVRRIAEVTILWLELSQILLFTLAQPICRHFKTMPHPFDLRDWFWYLSTGPQAVQRQKKTGSLWKSLFLSFSYISCKLKICSFSLKVTIIISGTQLTIYAPYDHLLCYSIPQVTWYVCLLQTFFTLAYSRYSEQYACQTMMCSTRMNRDSWNRKCSRKWFKTVQNHLNIIEVFDILVKNGFWNWLTIGLIELQKHWIFM